MINHSWLTIKLFGVSFLTRIICLYFLITELPILRFTVTWVIAFYTVVHIKSAIVCSPRNRQSLGITRVFQSFVSQYMQVGFLYILYKRELKLFSNNHLNILVILHKKQKLNPIKSTTWKKFSYWNRTFQVI